VTKTTTMSERTMQAVDHEIRRILDEQYVVARKHIEDNKDKMPRWPMRARVETIDTEQIDDIMDGKRRAAEGLAPSVSKPCSVPRSRRAAHLQRLTQRCTGCVATRGFGPVCMMMTMTHWQTTRYRST